MNQTVDIVKLVQFVCTSLLTSDILNAAQYNKVKKNKQILFFITLGNFLNLNVDFIIVSVKSF